MSRHDQKHSSAQVARAKRRIRQGRYDHPDVVDCLADLLLADRRPTALLRDLGECPTGIGDRYRDLTARVFLRAWSGKVQLQQIRREFSIAGGRGDLEVPFRIGATTDDAKLADWRQRFDLASLLIEVKNEHCAGPVDHVRQIADDLRNWRLGRVGFLVCRNGLTSKAKERLCEFNRDRTHLVLPFDHTDLRVLSTLEPEHVGDFMHEKERDARREV